MSTTPVRNRLGAVAFAGAALMFLLYPVTRPWGDTEAIIAQIIEARSSGWWVASHLFAAFGFILIPIGILVIRDLLGRHGSEPLAFAALITSWVGAGLTLVYYGAEIFGLRAIAVAAASSDSNDLLALARDYDFGPVAVAIFGIGLIALAAGAVMTAIAIGRSGLLPRRSGVLFALGMALFLPQFFTPPAARLGHGVLLAAGLVWLAAVLWRFRVATPSDSRLLESA